MSIMVILQRKPCIAQTDAPADVIRPSSKPSSFTLHWSVQEALNALDRVYSASSYTVAPCGQLQVACGQAAPEPEALLDADMLDTEILPFVDGIITSTGNASIEPVFAFSASTDPGTLLPLFLPGIVCPAMLQGGFAGSPPSGACILAIGLEFGTMLT